MTDDHGSCVHCNFDLNGDYIYQYFLREYGDHEKALETASHYGATETEGRFGKEIYVKDIWKRSPSYFKCPNCGGKCYDPSKPAGSF